MSTRPAKSPSAATADAAEVAVCAPARDGAPSSKVTRLRTSTETERTESSFLASAVTGTRIDASLVAAGSHLTPASPDVNRAATIPVALGSSSDHGAEEAEAGQGAGAFGERLSRPEYHTCLSRHPRFSPAPFSP